MSGVLLHSAYDVCRAQMQRAMRRFRAVAPRMSAHAARRCLLV